MEFLDSNSYFARIEESIGRFNGTTVDIFVHNQPINKLEFASSNGNGNNTLVDQDQVYTRCTINRPRSTQINAV